MLFIFHFNYFYNLNCNSIITNKKKKLKLMIDFFLYSFYFYLQELNLKLCKCDELDSLIRGLLFTVASNDNECYFWSQCTENEQCSIQEYTFQYNKYPFIVRIMFKKNE